MHWKWHVPLPLIVIIWCEIIYLFKHRAIWCLSTKVVRCIMCMYLSIEFLLQLFIGFSIFLLKRVRKILLVILWRKWFFIFICMKIVLYGILFIINLEIAYRCSFSRRTCKKYSSRTPWKVKNGYLTDCNFKLLLNPVWVGCILKLAVKYCCMYFSRSYRRISAKWLSKLCLHFVIRRSNNLEITS